MKKVSNTAITSIAGLLFLLSSHDHAVAQAGAPVPPIQSSQSTNVGDAFSLAGGAVSTASTVKKEVVDRVADVIKNPEVKPELEKSSHAFKAIGVASDMVGVTGKATSAMMRGDTPAVLGHAGQLAGMAATCVIGGTLANCVTNMATTSSLSGHARDAVADGGNMTFDADEDGSWNTAKNWERGLRQATTAWGCATGVAIWGSVAGCSTGADYTKWSIDGANWAVGKGIDAYFDHQDQRMLDEAEKNIPAAQERLHQKRQEMENQIEMEQEEDAREAAASFGDSSPSNIDDGSSFINQILLGTIIGIGEQNIAGNTVPNDGTAVPTPTSSPSQDSTNPSTASNPSSPCPAHYIKAIDGRCVHDDAFGISNP